MAAPSGNASGVFSGGNTVFSQTIYYLEKK